MAIQKYILCCDWGTSSFRLRLVDISGYKVISELSSGDGVAGTFRSWQEEGSSNRFDFYAVKLKAAIDQLAKSAGIDLHNIPVIVSGMASSSIGMEEIAYAPLPFAADGSQASAKVFKEFNGPDASLVLISGVKNDNDVMRGEEAQLIGLFNLEETSSVNKEDSIFVFPGTHSKHITVKDNLISSFHTFMTGEIFNILSEHSILKDSITPGSDFTDQENVSAFKYGVEMSGSSNLLNLLFTVRTNQLFSKFSKTQNSCYLSGLLIGTEMRQLINSYYAQLVICSGLHLYEHYKLAAEALDLTENITFIQPDLIDKATIAGQIQIFKILNTQLYE